MTSNQDFFGGAIVEAMYCECTPLLPNRLTYPQHLGEGNTDFLYQTEEEFKNKLKGMILDKTHTQKKLRERVSVYDWAKLISTYDKKFRDCVDSIG